jgi:hypothetical protein
MAEKDNNSIDRDMIYRDYLEYDITGSDGKLMRASFEPKTRKHFPDYGVFEQYVDMRQEGKSPEEASEYVENTIKDGKLVRLANSLKLKDLKGKEGLANIKNVLFEIGNLGFDFKMLTPEGYSPAGNSQDIRKFYDTSFFV